MGRESDDGEAFAHVSVCGCVYVCVCSCACAHVYVRRHSHSCLCVRVTGPFILYSKAPFSFVLCVHLAVLGTVCGGLASSAHERLLQRLAAVIAQRGIAALARFVLRPWHLESLDTLVKPFYVPWVDGGNFVGCVCACARLRMSQVYAHTLTHSVTFVCASGSPLEQ